MNIELKELISELNDACGDYTAWEKKLGYRTSAMLYLLDGQIVRLTAEVAELQRGLDANLCRRNCCTG